MGMKEMGHQERKRKSIRAKYNQHLQWQAKVKREYMRIQPHTFARRVRSLANQHIAQHILCVCPLYVGFKHSYKYIIFIYNKNGDAQSATMIRATILSGCCGNICYVINFHNSLSQFIIRQHILLRIIFILYFCCCG